jgi:hypothetical protein
VKDSLKGMANWAYGQMQMQREAVRKKYEEQNSTVKPEEARSQK